jgi:hypothetical protein
MSEVSIDRLVATYIKIRDARAAASSEHKKRDAELKEQLDLINNALLAKAHEDGVTGFTVKGVGTTYIDVDLQCSGSDWGVFYDWMKENDALDMLERRIKSTAIKTYMENHDGAIPPGVSTFAQQIMKIRKSSV